VIEHYGLDIWGDDNFIIDRDLLKINYRSSPSILEIVEQIRDNGIKGPLILRFPHLIQKQIDSIYHAFHRAKEEFNYSGHFNAVFPLKVNQLPNFVQNLTRLGEKYNYGLEAGSKAELFIALTFNNPKAPITVNGFKDKEMITLCFLAHKMGYNITVIIEGIDELENIIEVAEDFDLPYPDIGIRVRLHNMGTGIWAKSGGIASKFGLNSTELIKALKIIKVHKLTEKFKMIHFHIGSQISEISPLKKAIREAGHIFAELKRSGADGLDSINIGGGLAIEYSNDESRRDKNYMLAEYANDVVFLLKTIANAKGVDEPNIFIESGRFIAAPHALVVAPVLELFSHEYNEKELILKEENPPLIKELTELYRDINAKNALEFLHDALDRMDSLFTLFDLGYIDLQDRSNSEILVNLIIKKSLFFLKDKHFKEIIDIQNRVQERYLVNFSLFQSIPDFWGLNQNFPVMPLHNLSTKPTRSASIWDITCDSDGEVPFDKDNPLYLHDVDLEEEEYFLGFFLVGAYQEILGMRHNLFSHVNEAVIDIDDQHYTITDIKKSQSIIEILDDIDYDTAKLEAMLYAKIDSPYKEMLKDFLFDNGYLKTVQGLKCYSH
jgi:arginine decarboxylase